MERGSRALPRIELEIASKEPHGHRASGRVTPGRCYRGIRGERRIRHPRSKPPFPGVRGPDAPTESRDPRVVPSTPHERPWPRESPGSVCTSSSSAHSSRRPACGGSWAHGHLAPATAGAAGARATTCGSGPAVAMAELGRRAAPRIGVMPCTDSTPRNPGTRKQGARTSRSSVPPVRVQASLVDSTRAGSSPRGQH